MRKKNYSEKLFDNIDVQWKPLLEVCDFKNGFAFKRSLFRENGLPIVRIMNINGNTVDVADVKYFDPADYKENTKLYEVKNGDILIAMSGSIKIGCYTHKHTVYFNQRVGKFLPKKRVLNNRYLYHYLLAKIASIDALAHEGVIANLSSKRLMWQTYIPIPYPKSPEKSLKKQAEIGSILDTFSTLSTQLNTECFIRKKQYHYCRDRLFTFKKSQVEWKALGDIGEFSHGNGIQKKDFIAAGFPAIHYGQLYTHYALAADKTFTYVSKELANKLKKAQKNDLLLATTSENDEEVAKPLAWLGGPTVISGDMILFRHRQNVKYLAYFFHTEIFQRQKRKYITGVKVRRISGSNLAKILIPIPYSNNLKRSLAEQEHIVSNLDKFDTLNNSKSSGLLREIELRRKQYEYYRDLLLNFPKPQELTI